MQKHNTNNTKHNKYKYTYYQNTYTIVKAPTHYKEVETTTVQNTHKIKINLNIHKRNNTKTQHKQYKTQ